MPTGIHLRPEEVSKHSSDNIAVHVHSVLKMLLGHALEYVERHAHPSTVVLADSSVVGKAALVAVPSSPPPTQHETFGVVGVERTDKLVEHGNAHLRQNDGEGMTMSPWSENSLAANDAEVDIVKARSLLQVLHQEARMTRAKYTSLYYLEELGDKHAFDRVAVNMKDLSGENKETTRERILDLCAKKAVTKDPQSSRLQKISLTALGKKAYEMLRFVGSSNNSRESSPVSPGV